MAIAVACVVGFIALNLVRGRQGRVWQAVRDDPIAAAVSGISPAGSKISAFVVSSLFAALAGAVFAQILTYVGPGAFTLGLSLSLLVGIVLGGRNSFIGAIIGAVILVWLPEFVLDVSADRGWQDQITNNAPNFIYGLLVVGGPRGAGGIVGGIQASSGDSVAGQILIDSLTANAVSVQAPQGAFGAFRRPHERPSREMGLVLEARCPLWL